MKRDAAEILRDALALPTEARADLARSLLAHGANPLLVAAFRARKPSQQASAA